jgi:uncharacterized membrane-anchored protein
MSIDRGPVTEPVPPHSLGDTTPEPATPLTERQQRRAARRHQKQQFGGTKWGSAFFGWLTALGTAVLLGGIAAAVTDGYGLTTVPGGPPVGVVAVVVAAVVLFLAYFCGGYVAGRMARFDGARQGVAVWLWAVLVAVAVAVLVAVSGVPVDPPAALVGGVLDPAALTIGGLIGLSVVLLIGLVGAVLGGLAGMRFHRRVDRATPPPAP